MCTCPCNACLARPTGDSSDDDDGGGLITARDIGLDLGAAALTARTALADGGDGILTARDVGLELGTARGSKGGSRPGSAVAGSKPGECW